jgi:glycosyltransferase involved in cell wall biosynthesis/SAM-dependent methyltransferase
VDTWKGDAHAGYYGQEVFNAINALNGRRWQAFSSLLRMTFDEAREHFGTGEVDLLHIDGMHTYDAVSGDFARWRDTLSERGVVLFHDTNVRQQNFGVWRLWQELKNRHPHFEFVHGYGLGILGLGKITPKPLQALFAATADCEAEATVRGLFAARGAAVRTRFLANEAEVQAAAAMRTAKDIEAAAQTEQARLRAEMAQLTVAHEAEVTQLTATHKAEVAQITVAHEADVAQITATHEADVAQITATHEADVAQLKAAHEADVAQLKAAHEADVAQITVAHEVTTRAAQDLKAAVQAEQARLLTKVTQQVAAATTAREQRDALLASSSWRITRPLRIAAGLLRGEPSYLSALRHRLGRPNAQVPGRATPTLASSANNPTELPAKWPARFRVVYVSGEAHTPGHQYRVVRYAAAAEAAGAETTIMRLEEAANRLDEIAAAQAVVLWRAAWDETVERVIATAHQAGTRVIFDVDDLMIDPDLAKVELIDGIRSQSLTEKMVRDHYERVRRTMQHAHLCTVTTEELAHYARRAWLPTLVLPNGFDDATLAASRRAARRRAAAPPDGLLRIGYAGGSRTHQRDFALCAASIAGVLRQRPEARLVLFREAAYNTSLVDVDEFPELVGLQAQIEWRDRVPLDRLPEELARFDINLAPLEIGNAFCEAKSELKFFEAALADVVTIASPTGPFARAIRQGETGFLATTPEEWRAALERLLDDPTERARMARAARHDVLWTFGPERRAELMALAIDHIRGGRQAAHAFALGLNAPHRPEPLPNIPAHRAVFASDRLGDADVTVVIPLHNYAHYIEEALDSVARQSLTALDLIVIDDASADDGLAVAERWARRHADRFNRVLVLQNTRNAGLGFTRNLGFDQADTPYVLPLDADNRLLPDCLERCLTAARASRAAYAYPVIRQFGATRDVLGTWPFDPLRFVGGNYVDAMALVATSAWALVGGYQHVQFGWEDFEFWCRIAERGLLGVAVGGEPAAEYRVHASSMLRTTTEVLDNKRRLVTDMETRHPWLALTVPPEERCGPADALAVPDEGRLATLLPILRCPETGQPLMRDGEDALRTADGNRRWPLVAGRPVLFPALGTPRIHPEHHLSNPLPAHVTARIRATDGLVLNLSAGGTAERLKNVVEAEAAIFRHTDLVADSHHLPFADESFAGIVALNAFEHYANPERAAAEIRRVLKPGGWVLIQTAFLQPEHEAPWHFYNCTKHGLLRWFSGFETETVHVSENFNPVYAISWLASECEAALRRDAPVGVAEAFQAAPIGRLITAWRDPAARGDPVWQGFEALSQASQEAISAGFEYVGRRPAA